MRTILKNKHNILKLLLLFLLLLNLSFLYSVDYVNQIEKVKKKQEKQENENTNKITETGMSLLDDINAYRKKYTSNGDVLIIFPDKLNINNREAKKVANKINKELKNYLSYWFNYWKISVSFLNFDSYEIEADKDYINIVFTQLEELYDENSINRINNIIGKLKSIPEVQVSEGGRNIKIDLNSFINVNTMEMRALGFLVLDNIIEIMRYSNNNAGIKIGVYKKVNYNFSGASHKKILDKIYPILYELKKHNNESDIYILSKPQTDDFNQELDIVIFKDKIGKEGITKYFTDGDDSKIKQIDLNNIFISNMPKKYIYINGYSQDYSYYPTGWMGDSNDIKVDFNFKLDERECIKIEYIPLGHKGWAGITWQYPPNNWGNRNEGGFDLRGYKKLVFYARGEKGNEKVAEFKVGGVQGGQYGDSDTIWIGNIKLKDTWTRYEIDLKTKKLDNIISGFNFILNKYDNKYGCRIYLSEIYFE
ncbi:MAG: hypothetical protein LBF97_08375 [Elusimicrobiota bacterium]|jgi:hypothetical protein|nr:hypothetical protein [Elusimicrobiota bacterium]